MLIKLEPLEHTALVKLLEDDRGELVYHHLAYGIEEIALTAVQEKRWDDALKVFKAAIIYDLASIKTSASALVPAPRELMQGGIGRRGRPCLRIYDLYAGLAVRKNGDLENGVMSTLTDVVRLLEADSSW